MDVLRLQTLCAALAALLLSASSASADGFREPYSIDLSGGTPLASAIDAAGAAVVGDVRGPAGRRRVELALRARSGQPWTTTMLGADVSEARDVQTVIGGRGVVVAWAEAARKRQSVVVATGRAGGPIAIRRRLAVANAFSASPRLVRLRGGAVVLVWRDGNGSRSRVRVATIDGDRFTSAPRTVGTDVAQVVLATRGAGAAVGWTSAYRGRVRKTRLSVPRARPQPFTIRTLGAQGLPTGPLTVVARDVDATVRLAGASDWRLVASWVRPQRIRPYPGEARGDAPPPSAYVNPVAFTRQLLPRARPARPVGGPARPLSTPTVAFDDAGRALATLRVASSGGIPAYDIVASTSRAGGAWSAPRAIAAVGFSRFDPVAVAPAAGDLVIVHTAFVQTAAARPAWTVAATDASGAQQLGTTTASDGRGIAVARAPGRILVAWPLGGVVQIAERG